MAVSLLEMKQRPLGLITSILWNQRLPFGAYYFIVLVVEARLCKEDEYTPADDVTRSVFCCGRLNMVVGMEVSVTE